MTLFPPVPEGKATYRLSDRSRQIPAGMPAVDLLLTWAPVAVKMRMVLVFEETNRRPSESHATPAGLDTEVKVDTTFDVEIFLIAPTR